MDYLGFADKLRTSGYSAADALKIAKIAQEFFASKQSAPTMWPRVLEPTSQLGVPVRMQNGVRAFECLRLQPPENTMGAGED